MRSHGDALVLPAEDPLAQVQQVVVRCWAIDQDPSTCRTHLNKKCGDIFVVLWRHGNSVEQEQGHIGDVCRFDDAVTNVLWADTRLLEVPLQK